MTAYDPWRNLSELQNEMNRLFADRLGDSGAAAEGPRSGWIPPVDIRERAEGYEIRVDLPGVDPQNVEVTLEGDTLTIQGHRSEEREVEGSAPQLRRRERIRGPFHRSFHIPDSADPDQVRARYDAGVLTVEIPKAERAQARRIEIQT
jgi:HSP20 family protein